MADCRVPAESVVGWQSVVLENDELRAKFDAEWGVAVPPIRGWHLSGMFDAIERGDLTAVYCIGENPVQSEADQKLAIHLLESLEFLVVQDLFLTKTAALADVVLPATAAWAESEGTVTNSERRVQRVRKAVEPPAGARDDLAHGFRFRPGLGAIGRLGAQELDPPVAQGRQVPIAKHLAHAFQHRVGLALGLARRVARAQTIFNMMLDCLDNHYGVVNHDPDR